MESAIVPVATPFQVTWENVEDAARSLFNIWTHGRELEWAREAWNYLADAGLTHYSTEIERCEVAIRLMTLASLYRDWCTVADDENQDDDLTWWADELEISTFRLGQLVGPDFREEEEGEDELKEHLTRTDQLDDILVLVRQAFELHSDEQDDGSLVSSTSDENGEELAELL